MVLDDADPRLGSSLITQDWFLCERLTDDFCLWSSIDLEGCRVWLFLPLTLRSKPQFSWLRLLTLVVLLNDDGCFMVNASL